MTSGGNDCNDFPEKQLIKLRAVLNSTKLNRDYAFLCSRQDFSLITTVLWIYTD